MTEHLFKDLFRKFRFFFHTKEYKESRFLYDVSFGFMPRRFDTSEEDRVIYDEEDEVPEMYFMLAGTVGIGYSLMFSGVNKKPFRIAKKVKATTLICDHAVVNNLRSEFLYIVIKPI